MNIAGLILSNLNRGKLPEMTNLSKERKKNVHKERNHP